MFKSILSRKRNRAQRDGLDRRSGTLLPKDRLAFYLERARLRANRNGLEFSLLALTIDTERLQDKSYLVLEEILDKRLRFTDDMGYLDLGRVGIVLPDTPEEGAHVLAKELLRRYHEAGGHFDYEVYVYPSDFDLDGSRLEESDAKDTLAIPRARPTAQRMDTLFSTPLPLWKRAFDLAGAFALIVCFIPLMLFAALLVRVSSPGPILFFQERHGLGGRRFLIFKFRTMRVGADAEKAALRQYSEVDGPAFKLRDDPRTTKIGRFLRKTSIDELPQLFNVLQGTMSLVGPRPLPVEESAACEPWQRKRLDVTPGLTCIWQVRGRSRVAFADWIRMDLEYMESVSFWSDLKLLALTAPSVLLRRGAH